MSGSVSASAKGKGSKVNSTSFGGGLPINESDSDNSVTRATLSEGKITLNKDSEPTQTTAQALGINTDINQANSQVNAPKDVKQQLSEQRQISAAAGHIRDAVNTYMANQQKAAIKEMAALQAEREELVKRNDKVALAKVDEKLITLLKESEEWGNEGKYRRALDAITSAGVAALTGQSAQGIAVTAASPYVNQAIKNATTDEQTGKVNKVTNIAAHALWGAVEINALGGSSTAGALSAGGAELVAPQIAKVLYDKAPNELTSSEKQRVIALSGVIGKAIGGITSAAKGGDTYAISKNSDISGNIAKNAVENNAVFKARGEHYLTQLQKLKKKTPEEKNRLLREMGTESVRNNGAIRSACEVNVAQCRQYIQMLEEARNYYIEEQTKHPEWVYSEEGKMLKTLQSWAEFDIKMAKNIMAEKEKYKLRKNPEPFRGTSEIYKDGRKTKGVWGDGNFAAGLNEPPPDYITVQAFSGALSVPLYGKFKIYAGGGVSKDHKGKSSYDGISVKFGDILDEDDAEIQKLKNMGVYRPSTKFVPEKRAELVNDFLPGMSAGSNVCATILCVGHAMSIPSDKNGTPKHAVEYGIGVSPSAILGLSPASALSIGGGVGVTKELFSNDK